VIGESRELVRDQPWPFSDGRFPAQLGVVVQQTVLAGDLPALLVVHDDENDWLIGDGTNDPNLPGASVIAHMSHIVDQNSSVADLADLPLGWVARREAAGQPWIRMRHEWAPDEGKS
jgi:hypothetical protein